MPHTFVFDRRLNRLDALHYHLGEHRRANVAMCMVALLDRDIGVDTMRDGFAMAAEEIPRFKDRLRPTPASLAPPVWEPDPDFDIRDRFRAIPSDEPLDWTAALDALDAHQSAPFDLRRPPWSVLYIRGTPGGTGLVALKLHHALSDGTALTLMLSKVFMREALGDVAADIRAVGSPPPASVAREAARQQLRGAVDAATTAASALARSVRDAQERRAHLQELREYVRGPRRWPTARHSPARSSAFFRVSLEAWRSAARRRSGSVNELYVALAAAALRRYLVADGADDGGELAIVMPIDVRGDHERQDGGNMTGAGILRLRGTDAELADLGGVVRQSAAAQAAAGHQPASAIDGLLSLCPSAMQRRAIFRRFSTKDALATNVIVPLRCGLHEAQAEMVFILPPVIGTPVSFALAGYDDALHLAINMDLGLIAAPERFAQILRDLLVELCGADAVTAIARQGTRAATAAA